MLSDMWETLSTIASTLWNAVKTIRGVVATILFLFTLLAPTYKGLVVLDGRRRWICVVIVVLFSFWAFARRIMRLEKELGQSSTFDVRVSWNGYTFPPFVQQGHPFRITIPMVITNRSQTNRANVTIYAEIKFLASDGALIGTIRVSDCAYGSARAGMLDGNRILLEPAETLEGEFEFCTPSPPDFFHVDPDRFAATVGPESTLTGPANVTLWARDNLHDLWHPIETSPPLSMRPAE